MTFGFVRSRPGLVHQRRHGGVSVARLVRLLKYSPDQPRDERGRWTDGGGEHSVTVEGNTARMTLSAGAEASGERLVSADTAAMDRGFQRDGEFYVGRGGAGGSSFKYDQAAAAFRSASSIEAPSAGVFRDGRVAFTDGRHRFAAMRDAGVKRAVVSMDSRSIAAARAHGYL